jgi:hypothetical protein
MSVWKNIRLELARTAQFPAGSVSRGYLIRLPLGDSDHVDRRTLQKTPHRATVRRYWSTEPDEAGVVEEASNGSWALRCNGSAPRMMLVENLPIRLGQLVSVVEEDGKKLPFRIASIR